MAIKATPVTEAEKDEPNVQAVPVNIPRIDEPVMTYMRVEQVDDLTGEAGPGIETVYLTVPVKAEVIEYDNFEIDLSPASLAKLIEALEPFKAKARAAEKKAPAQLAVKRSTSKSSNPARTEWTQRARAWLEANRPKTGVSTSDRGRLKEDFQDLYIAFNPDDPRP